LWRDWILRVNQTSYAGNRGCSCVVQSFSGTRIVITISRSRAVSTGPPRSLRHGHLEPGSLAGLARLFDSDTGDRENLPRKCQTKPGVLPEPTFEDLLLLSGNDTLAIILADDEMITILFFCRETDGRNLPAVPPYGREGGESRSCGYGFYHGL